MIKVYSFKECFQWHIHYTCYHISKGSMDEKIIIGKIQFKSNIFLANIITFYLFLFLKYCLLGYYQDSGLPFS